MSSSSCKDQLELIKQTLDADRVRLAQVRSHLNSSSSVKSTPSTPSTRRQPAPASLDDQNNVFNRLYENPKRVRSSDLTASSSSSTPTKKTTEATTTFRPQIDSKSRQLASRVDRASLYDRAKEQRDRQEQRIAKEDANLHDLRNKSRLSTCSRELSFNPLRKEMEQRFARHDSGGVTASELHDVLVSLGLSGFDVFNRIAKHSPSPATTVLQVSQVVDFFFQVFCAEDDELDAKLRVCLFAINQDIASNLRMAKAKQLAEQVAQRETPFRPRGLVKSHLLDEQRMEKLGIDPALSREEKLIQVGQKTKLGLLESQKRWQEKQQEECTFRPQLSSSSCSFVSSASSLDGGGGDAGEDVVSRLYQDSFRRRHRLQEMQSEHQAQVELFEVSECTFQPVLLSKRKAPAPSQPLPPPPPPPAFAAAAAPTATTSRVVFQAQVELPNGGSELVTVREGDRVQDVSARFAQRHRLDAGALAALTNALLQALGQQQGDDEEELVEDALVVDIVVRQGETHQLTVRAGEDPSAAARAFAKLHRMDREALSELIDSLRSVV